MPGAFFSIVMICATPICSISTRPAYFGTRRIAPVAATSRTEAWGARPAVEELRPARRHNGQESTTPVQPSLMFSSPFIAHVIGQFAPHHLIDAKRASQSYEAADALGRGDTQWVVAAL